MGERKRKIEWQVIRLRSRGEYLGTAYAPVQQAALEAALETFAPDKKEEKRLLIRRA